MLFFQCGRKTSVLSKEVVDDEPISYDGRIDRNDIPPPPSTPWWTINTEDLTTCQKILWAYLNKFYPISDNNNPEYQIYTLDRQIANLGSNNHLLNTFARFFTLEFLENYLNNSEYACRDELNANFFEGALGAPTCITYNHQDSVVIYLYHVKMRFRHGPCPFTQQNGKTVGNYCSTIQTQFCSTLRTMFSMETGELEYIDFRR
ncbi:MAG: hypothetical protein MI974_27670 [Chitinophagales bacterium]|nr:hypothetical protein [Chitinophagales bacterium]